MPGGISAKMATMNDTGDATRPMAAASTSLAATLPDERCTRHLLAAVDVHQHGMTTCPSCDGAALCRWGTNRRELQRWRCRDCLRSFTAATGTPLAHVHSLDKLREVAVDMLGSKPRSCRALAAALGLDRMTVWRWRRLIAGVWARLAPLPACGDSDCDGVGDGDGDGDGEAGITVLRESRKASREWVDHYRDPARHPAPDRLRWIDYRQLDLPLPEPMCRYRVPVLLTMTGPHPIGSPSCAAAGDRHPDVNRRASELAPAASSGAAVLEDDHRRTRPAIGSGPVDARLSDEPFGLSLGQRFSHFLAPFRGPATRHLPTYTAWFAARLRTTVRPQGAPS